MDIDSQTGIWIGEDRHRVYDQTLAERIVELCREKKFSSVVDLGCGAGFYVQHIKNAGIECSGYDGNPHTPEITDHLCGVLDLSKPISIGTHACVMSLEVGEHIPEAFQEVYLTNVLNAARDYLILSWARPGQGGLGHFNERPQSEIVARIERDGLWKLDPSATYVLRTSSSLPWFQTTLLCFSRTNRSNSEVVTAALPDYRNIVEDPNCLFDNARQLRDDAFRRRMKNSPEAAALAFWEKHFCTQEALNSSDLHGRILDFGCGTGDIDILLARQGRDVVGFDFSPVALDVAELHRSREDQAVKDRVRFALGNSGSLPFPDQSFDSIFTNHALENFPQLTPTLKELARVLKPGGALVALVSQGLAYYDMSRAHTFAADTLQETLSPYFESVDVTIQTDRAQLKVVCRNSQPTHFPRIICMMRIRNEERWIKEVLDSVARTADGIVIVDDGSTDNTPLICKFHPAVVDYHWQQEPETDQRRDKQRCLQMALAQNPDWILGLDADEPLERYAAPRIFEALRNCPADVSVLKIESLFMWNDLQHYRADGIYEHICQERLFRVAGQDPSTLRYEPTKFRGNGHCTRLPAGIKGREQEIDVKILHLGYMYPDVRARRYEYYRRRDPKEFANGDYAHLLDQPGQILKEWQERPYRQTKSAPPAAAAKQELKPDYYYANARRDLLAHIPLSARRVLDVGCGHGLTGGLLRRERSCFVAGLEIHAETAQIARENLDEVYVGDIETMELPFPARSFDCILLGDVLEHLIDPWQAVRRLKDLLTPNGTVVASLPNVRNLAVMKSLSEGSWAYEEYGILDKTHLRFFTLREMHDLFAKTGFDCDLVETVCDPLFRSQMETPQPASQDIDLGKMQLKNVSPEEMRELTAIQFYFVARQKTPEVLKPKASIIIPVFNNLKYTRSCITSLFAVQEPMPFEVIVVNNASTDGTRDYLEQLGTAVRSIHVSENLGFAKACNLGAKAAQGDVVVFLNNDTEVLPDWLSAMVSCLESDGTIGLVGNLQIYPDSKRVQQAGIVCGPNAMVYSLYNNLLPATHPAVIKPRDFQFVAGSCMALRRTEFLSLGGFDESYVNSCEDIDLCLRVRESGKRVHYCPASKIYHHESKTATGHDKAGPNYRRLLARWRDKMPPDDLRYFAEDGFHFDAATNTLTEIPTTTAVSAEHPMNMKPTREENLPRVAILSTYHQRCGLAAYAQFMVDALRAQGLSPLVLAEDTPNTLAPDDDHVLRCWTRAADGGSRIAALIEQHHIDILHVNYGGYFALDGWLEDVLRVLRVRGVRVVLTFHTTATSSEKLGALGRLADLCYVHHSQNTLELVALGCPPDRVEQLPLGMPPVQKTDIFESKLALGWDPAAKVVSTFGFVEPHKGILELINALQVVNQAEPVQLLVIGGANPENPASAGYFEACKARVAELGLTQRVRFTDEFVEEERALNFLRASNVIVLNYSSNRYEASQSCAIALATGRPVITSQAPAFDYPAALTFKTTNEFPLTDAILHLLRNPFVGRMMLNEVIAYEKTAGWPAVARRITEAYRRILSAPLKEDVDFLRFYATHPDDIYADALQRERLRWLKSKARGRILEIGPATGYVAEYTGAAAAVDIYRGRLHVAAALRPDTKFHEGNVLHGLPFADHEFDQVLAPEIFEHVDFDDAVRALKECLRVGRSVLVTMPCADKPDYNPDLVHVIEHRWIVNRGTVTELLKRAGCSNYVIDVSPNHDFYLLEIGTAAGRVLTDRAAALPTVRLDEDGDPLHVAIDLSCLENATLAQDDFSRSATALLPALFAHRPHWTWTLTSSQSQPTSSATRQLIQSANGGFKPWASVAAQQPDVVYLTHPFVPDLENLLLLAKQAQSAVAASFSDLIPLRFADVYLSPQPEFKTYYANRLSLLMKSCDLFLCQSQQTTQDMQVHLGLPSSQLRINHGAAFPEFASATCKDATELLNRFSLRDGQYVVVPPSYLPHKNIPLAIVAFARAKQRIGSNLQLVLHGNMPQSFHELLHRHAAAQQLAAEDLVLLGDLTPADVAALYRHASVIFSPSSYEGFPQGIMNGLACAVPVLTGANSSMAEILAAEHMVEVNHTDAVIKRLTAALQDSAVRERMIQTGRELSAHFTWQRTAEKAIMYLTEFIGHRRIASPSEAPTVKTRSQRVPAL